MSLSIACTPQIIDFCTSTTSLEAETTAYRHHVNEQRRHVRSTVGSNDLRAVVERAKLHGLPFQTVAQEQTFHQHGGGP